MNESDANDVRTLCEIDAGLTPWEVEFAESLHRQVVRDGIALTPRQRATLDKILERFGK